MQYTIDDSATGNYLMVKVVGKITIPFAIEFTDAAHRAVAERGLYKILYDVTEAENVESAIENFSLIHDELPRLKVKRTTQVVLLTAPRDHSHDFIETAARNAGYNVTICRDLNAALEKLEETKPASV